MRSISYVIEERGRTVFSVIVLISENHVRRRIARRARRRSPHYGQGRCYAPSGDSRRVFLLRYHSLRSYSELTTRILHCLDTVQHEVHQRLLQLHAICHHSRKFLRKVAANRRMAGTKNVSNGSIGHERRIRSVPPEPCRLDPLQPTSYRSALPIPSQYHEVSRCIDINQIDCSAPKGGGIYHRVNSRGPDLLSRDHCSPFAK